MPTTAELYDTDFVRWTEEQAKALRSAAGSDSAAPLDWGHLAEEIESLGISYRRELGSRVGTIIEHLFKLQFSTATDPRRGWTDTVARERVEVEALIAENPSLRPKLPGVVEGELKRRKALTLSLLERHGEGNSEVRNAIATTDYSPQQVLGDWLPPNAPSSWSP